MAGNPPWLKVQFEEKGLIAEVYPEVEIRKMPAPQVRLLQKKFLEDASLESTYIQGVITNDAMASFLNATQNYPLLRGQQTNLYMCVLENGFSLLSTQGLMGLIHPEGIYDDPNGALIRQEMYKRLRYHFQFINELSLFASIDHHNKYGIHVYSGAVGVVGFHSISNLFHPSTISGCFVEGLSGICGGIKTKDDITGNYIWNIKPHAKRKVFVNLGVLKIIDQTFERSGKAESTKLVAIHSTDIINVLEKISKLSSTFGANNPKISECWHETNDVNEGHIIRRTLYPEVEKFQMVYSGPHLFVSNPLYKTPTKLCTHNSHYDTIDLNLTTVDTIARTNYLPVNVNADFEKEFPGFVIGSNSTGVPVYDSWLRYYKLGIRKMLNDAGERTLIGAILPPKSSHVFGIVSVTFQDEHKLVEATAMCSSIVLDFFLRALGVANLTDSRISGFPIGIAAKYKPALFARTLALNCVNIYYAPLWEGQWQDVYQKQSWSKNIRCFKSFDFLSAEWGNDTPLRNWLERRQALVEIDVLSAQALGLTLSELELIYLMQFPVLQQNEDDTWYDQRGNIVFTCSKGLSGVGLDRGDWESIRDFKEGETYEHTITKSELYQGQKVTYYAPFAKCDRIEDYRVAWAHFESTLPAK